MNCLYGIPSLPWIHFKILSYFSLSQVIVSDTFGRFFDKIQISVKKSTIEMDERKDIKKISSTLSYYFHSKGEKFKGKKSNFLKAFTGIMGNVNILLNFCI